VTAPPLIGDDVDADAGRFAAGVTLEFRGVDENAEVVWEPNDLLRGVCLFVDNKSRSSSSIPNDIKSIAADAADVGGSCRVLGLAELFERGMDRWL